MLASGKNAKWQWPWGPWLFWSGGCGSDLTGHSCASGWEHHGVPSRAPGPGFPGPACCTEGETAAQQLVPPQVGPQPSADACPPGLRVSPRRLPPQTLRRGGTESQAGAGLGHRLQPGPLKHGPLQTAKPVALSRGLSRGGRWAEEQGRGHRQRRLAGPLRASGAGGGPRNVPGAVFLICPGVRILFPAGGHDGRINVGKIPHGHIHAPPRPRHTQTCTGARTHTCATR